MERPRHCSAVAASTVAGRVTNVKASFNDLIGDLRVLENERLVGITCGEPRDRL